MRFARLAVAVSLPVVALGALGTGCSDAVPPIPRGAYSVAFSDPGVECQVAGHGNAVGEVSDSTKQKLYSNGEDGAEVECSVVGSGSFNATGKIYKGGSILQISIGSIAASATAAAPAIGSVSFASEKTQASYNSNECQFYFVPNTDEGVDSGKLWVAFKCPTITSEQSVCKIDVGYVILENCSTGSEEEE
jgi:hypothetical protein